MKKTLRIAGKFLLVLLLIPIIVLLYIWVSNAVYVGVADEKNVAYLLENQKTLSVENPASFAAEGLFDEDFYQSDVFLLGESHGFADVQKVDQLLLMHLNKKIGLRYYIAEMDSSKANRLNLFLAASQKDTSLLRQVVIEIKQSIPQQSSKELYQKWSSLYDYNQQLADSLKITVLGIDKDLQDTTTSISRDSIMLLNFRHIVKTKKLENEKFYGLFGYSHVLQNGINHGNFRPFACKLKLSDVGYGKRIKSIMCYNLDSEAYFPKNDQYPSPSDEKTEMLNVDGPLVMVKGIKDLRASTTENSTTLFNLDKEQSPYQNSQLLAGVKVNFFGGEVLPHNEVQKTTDFFQYVILIRNSKALTRLE